MGGRSTSLARHARPPGPPTPTRPGGAGVERWYAIASVAGAETGPVRCPRPCPRRRSTAAAPIRPHRRQRQAGSPTWCGHDRLRAALSPTRQARRGVADALALARDGSAPPGPPHAIFHDDPSSIASASTTSRCRRRLRQGARARAQPFVELWLMLRELAESVRDRLRIGAGISPPHDWDARGALCGGFGAHSSSGTGSTRWRSGASSWNEANLEVFWTGNREEHLRLYDLADRRSRPSTGRSGGRAGLGGGGWIPDSATTPSPAGSPLDFLTTTPTETCRSTCASHCGYAASTTSRLVDEWGVTPTHFYAIDDTGSRRGSSCTARSRRRSRGFARLLGRLRPLRGAGPPASLHGGFGPDRRQPAQPRRWA